ncbi:MAG: TRAP transporter large permease [Myxococcales bacterium]|nr:TRAP transporter large permease [Myxococcales bacterium]
MTLIIVIGLILLFALGAPIFAVMLMASAYGATQTSRGGFMQDFGAQMGDIVKIGTGEEALILSTIPLFIFMGFVMAEAKTADRLVRAARAGLGWMPGGLAVVTIFACAVFTTFTGASGVTIVALGGLIMPSLLKEKYPEKFSLGLVAGTGSVGLLFPPALPLFVYGTVYGLAAQTQSDSGGSEMELIEFSTDRFIFAGVVPGLILLLIMSVFAVTVAIKRKVPRHKFNAAELVEACIQAIPEMLLPVFILLGLANGVTIAQIACLACIYIIFVEVVLFRDVKITQLWHLVRDSMALVGAIFIIIFAASALTNFFVTAEVPQMLFHWIQDNFESKWTFLLALNVFLLLVGMTMDIFSAIVVVVPLITPVAAAYGINPYHLGVIFLLNLELGYLTPPVGLNLFITGFTFKKPIDEVVRSVVPFFICMVIALILVTYVEAITVKPLDVIKPPARRGRVAQMATEVRQEYQKLSAVQEVTLESGEKVTFEGCAKIADTDEKDVCEGLFLDITNCRNEKTGTELAECEKTAKTDYLDLRGDDIAVGDGDEDYPDLEGEDEDEDYPDLEDEEGGDTVDGEDEEYPDLEGEDETPTPKPAPAASEEDEEYPDLEDEE